MIEKSLANKLVGIAIKQLYTCDNFKKPRLEKIEKYEAAYNGEVKAKMRITFNAPFPVLSGLVDTLMADFDDPISLQFKENDPADYNAIKKVNAAWLNQKDMLDTDLMWDMKLRWDRRNAIMTGRGIQEYFIESDPDFRQHFEVIKLKDFIFEPKGGGHLENHLFVGVKNYERTASQIQEAVDNGYYDAEEWQKLKDVHNNTDYKPDTSVDLVNSYLANFKSLGLDPESNNYIGENVFKLVKLCLTHEGKRYFIVFDPYSQIPLRAELLSDITESNLYPWTSWATHEESENFLSKSYCDDFYPIHDTIATLISQELTNRGKQNVNARAYDPEMFPDVAKLDEASYRMDALVPINTQGGTRKIGDGLYEFKVSELNGTIELANWMQSELSKNTGVYEIQSSGAGKGKANVQYSLLQQAQKRLSYKAHSYSQCYTEIGLRYLWGLKEHMPSKMMVQLSGTEGYGWDELRRNEINFKKKPNIKIINQTEQDKINVLGKDQKIQAIKDLIGNEALMQTLNPKKLSEIMLRDIGGWGDQDIFELMDTQSFASKNIMTEADKAIQEMTKGKKPDICYIANIAFLQKVFNFEKTHHLTLGDKSLLFHDYIIEMAPIVMENTISFAVQFKQAQLQQQGGQQGQQQVPQGGLNMPINRQNPTAQVTPQAQPMAVGGGV